MAKYLVITPEYLAPRRTKSSSSGWMEYLIIKYSMPATFALPVFEGIY